MDTKSSQPSDTTGIPWRAVIRFLFTTVFTLGVLFLSAGRLQWWEGWACTGMTLFVLVLSRSLILLKNPDMARRRRQKGGCQGLGQDTCSADCDLLPAGFLDYRWTGRAFRLDA
jgi:hypothetical protein